ncbi:hypothetical protein T10_11826 [Trichinella papuae]|uniref:Uncharacterized protein n=1 Tax=Trichinella papuae TaxID=268474 RepID=A0A0V1MV39_9BILA|nr:hypothetical protein T10_11826 [Trichinella papuae]
MDALSSDMHVTNHLIGRKFKSNLEKSKELCIFVSIKKSNESTFNFNTCSRNGQLSFKKIHYANFM